MKFWLGTHLPHWLEFADRGLMVSYRRLIGRRTLPAARHPWVLDSGGFTEVSTYGRWTIGPHQYATDVRYLADRIGHLEWAAPQDWMCEPWIVAKTGLTIADHQVRTVDNYLRLQDIAPDLPFIPVLQGFTLADYHRCADLYEREGVDLAGHAVVGIGSVCRRQGTSEAAEIIRAMAGRGYRLHGFGLKSQAIARCGDALESADSLAWSYNARRNPPLAGCSHQSCANCYRWARRWGDRINRRAAQGVLFA